MTCSSVKWSTSKCHEILHSGWSLWVQSLKACPMVNISSPNQGYKPFRYGKYGSPKTPMKGNHSQNQAISDSITQQNPWLLTGKQVSKEAVIGSANLIHLLRPAPCQPVSSILVLICYLPLFSLRASHFLLPQSIVFFHYSAAQGHRECSNLRPPVTLTE